MNNSYDDIRMKIAEEPRWWDEHAVPRYCDFSPSEAANIYADECCLVLIECQGCDEEFHVAFSQTWYETMETTRALASYVKDGDLHYGDPPNADCCAAGPTMNSVPVKVVEFWRREQFEWERVPELEVDIS